MDSLRDVVGEALFNTLAIWDRPLWGMMTQEERKEFLEDADRIIRALSDSGLITINEDGTARL